MKNYAKITFEGSGIPLWELKTEIITQRKMSSNDFDLIFYDSETNEEIKDEYQMIYKNSQIIVKRIPSWMSKKKNLDFQELLKEKAQKQNMHLEKPREQVTRSYKAPPPNYICFRCGQKGHFIQHCPTNQDKNYDIVKIRKPTGIPKAFLVPIKSSEIDESQAMLVTEHGGYVRVQPQVQEWKRFSARNVLPSEYPKSLICPKCNSLFNNPVKANCGDVFCDDCINLNENCSVCGVFIERFTEDHTKKQEIERFLEKQ
ncbi:hypothetical protein TCON_1900 [Astathelohania contejeani]|uniref:Uncharacterized protein n=1 Tax=Astathelohania contejeani TaxID=164912 RepID=A0ABQ7HXI0_9MICR|nr:hypothetical protein TCON_1900 [Thelohania contejeani]